MLLINKVWPLLIIGISKLAPSMFQFWLRPNIFIHLLLKLELMRAA